MSVINEELEKLSTNPEQLLRCVRCPHSQIHLSNTFQSWDLKLLTELDEWQNALGQHNVQVGERAFQVAFDLLSPELINTRMHLYTIYNFIRLRLLTFLQTLPQYCKSRSLQQIRWMNGM